MTRRLVSLLTAVLVTGCGEAWLTVGLSTRQFDGRTQRAVIRVQAFEPGGMPGAGTVTLSPSAGTLVEGDTLTLRDGFGSRTLSCDPSVDARCQGAVTVEVRWGELSRAVTVQVEDAPATEPAPAYVVVPTRSTATLHDAVAGVDGVVWAVGTGGTVLRLDDGEWSPVATPTSEDLLAVALDAAGSPVVVGEGPVLLTFEDGGFVARPVDGAQGALISVLPGAGGTHLLGTSGGQLLAWDGVTTQVETNLHSPVEQLLEGGGERWGVADGVVARERAGVWSPQPLPALARRARAVLTGTTFIAGGADPQGTGWLILGDTRTSAAAWEPLPVSAAITDVVVTAAGARLALTRTSLMVDPGSGDWTEQLLPMGGEAMVSRGPTDLVIVGPPGLSLVRVR